MTEPTDHETFDPYEVVNLVVDHLTERGLNPVHTGTEEPADAATELLRAMGIDPAGRP